jgi:hypothetical protein
MRANLKAPPHRVNGRGHGTERTTSRRARHDIRNGVVSSSPDLDLSAPTERSSMTFSTHDLAFGRLARQVMYHFCCETVLDMEALTDDEILSLRGVGKKTLHEIRWLLAQHRLEHSEAEREQWLAETAFEREFEGALAKFMHGWLDDAPSAASNRFWHYRYDLRRIDDKAVSVARSREEGPVLLAIRKAREGWTGLDRNVKMGRILSALGDDGLTRSEIAERIEGAQPGITVYDSDVLPLLNEMLATGEAEREKEPRTPNCTITARGGYRWRWRRRIPNMSPEMQDLEQRLKET